MPSNPIGWRIESRLRPDSQPQRRKPTSVVSWASPSCRPDLHFGPRVPFSIPQAPSIGSATNRRLEIPVLNASQPPTAHGAHDIEVGSGFHPAAGLRPGVSRRIERRRLKSRRQDEILTPHRIPPALRRNSVGIHFCVAHPRPCACKPAQERQWKGEVLSQRIVVRGSRPASVSQHHTGRGRLPPGKRHPGRFGAGQRHAHHGFRFHQRR